MKSDLIADNGALIGIDTNFDCVRDINLVMRPCPVPNNLLRVDKELGPVDDSSNFPGTRPIDGHLDVIDTEIVSMCLVSGGVTMYAGAGAPTLSPLLNSLGAVAEQPGNPSLADSFFDVFVEVQGPLGTLHNLQPFRVQSQITCLPPKANYIHPAQLCIPLFTPGVCQGGPNNGHPCVYDVECPLGQCVGRNIVANLVEANHSVNLPVCGSNPTLCTGTCPAANEFCATDPATQLCGCQRECQQAPYPQCGGLCPLGQTCQPGGGHCTCGPPPPPACSLTPFGECLGPCPTPPPGTPQTTCQRGPLPNSCACLPPPVQCEQGPFPACTNTCPPGLTCRADTATGKCTCVPPACDQGPFPQCTGSCPPGSPGLICLPNSATGAGVCNCATPPCEQSPFPTCLGPCPPGKTCRPDPLTNHCTCVTLPCEQSPFSTCLGPCPPGNTCRPSPVAGVGCECVPLPCEQSLTCGGPCPLPGQICQQVSGTTSCTCAPPPCSGVPPACGGACPAGEVCQSSAAGCGCVPVPCEQSLTCGGPCPLPGQICQQVSGTTSCTCAPPPCSGVPPACGGACPAGETCQGNAAGCGCVPIPCDQSPYPACVAGCPVGHVCKPDPATGHCRCVLPPCAQSPFPQCLGPCPPGQKCVGSTALGKCICVTPPCTDGPYPQCLGACPTGQSCIPNATGHCDCVAPATCDQGTYPQCGGTCPVVAGTTLTCVPDVTGKCKCVRPCEQGPFPECSGTCPPGSVCEPTSAGKCICKSPPPPLCQNAGGPACNGTCPPAQVCVRRAVVPPACQCLPCIQVPPPDIHGQIWSDRDHQVWVRAPCAWVYNAYRITARSLSDMDHNGVADDYGMCMQNDLTMNELVDTSMPPAGSSFFDIFTGENEMGEGTMGMASNGLGRPNYSPCP